MSLDLIDRKEVKTDMKCIKFIISLILCLAISTPCFAVRIFRFEEPMKENVLYSDRFADGIADDWTVLNLHSNAPYYHIAEYGGEKWYVNDLSNWKRTTMLSGYDVSEKNYTVSADFMTDTGNVWGGLVLRGASGSQFYCYALDLSNKNVLVAKQSGNSWTILEDKNTAVNYSVGATVNMKAKVEGNKISIWFNDKFIHEYEDPNVISTGGAGVFVYNGRTYFKNFKVVKNSDSEKSIKTAVAEASDYVIYDKNEINSFSDAIIDVLGWDSNSLNTVSGEDNILTLKPLDYTAPYNCFGYGRKQFTDSINVFEMMPDDLSKGISMTLRSQKLSLVGNNYGMGYRLDINNDNVSIVKMFKNKDTVLATVENSVIKEKEWNKIEFNVASLDNSVELKLIANGIEILKAYDSESPVKSMGYTNFMVASGTLQLRPDDNHEYSLKQTIGGGVAYSIGAKKAYIMGDVAELSAIPFKDGESIMIPVRVTAEGMGGNVSWNDETKAVNVKLAGKNIVMNEGFSSCFVNEVKRNMRKAPVIISGVTYCDAEDFADIIGYSSLVNENVIIFSMTEKKGIDGETIKNIKEMLGN